MARLTLALIASYVLCLSSGTLADDKAKAPPDERIAAELKKAKEDYRAGIEKAGQTLLAEFDEQLKKLEGNKTLKLEQQIKLFEQLKEEKDAYATDATKLPKSQLMRTAVNDYKAKIAAAKKICEGAFDKAAEGYRDRKDLASAKATLEQKAKFLENLPIGKVGTADAKDPKPGDVREFDVGNGVIMKFCWIPATKGKAPLGSPRREKERLGNSEAEHEVELDGFWLAKYAMTQSQYVTLTGKKNPSYFCAEGKNKDKVRGMNTVDFPVENVSWNDAQECISVMKAPQGMGRICLPSEAQWEWAARGGCGNGRAFYWGDALNGDKANCSGTRPYGTETKGPFLERTAKVGSYEAKARHPWGLCDMIGNVSQWCEDYYGEYAKLPAGKNPVQTVEQSESHRVYRGGSWNFPPSGCRSAIRGYVPPETRSVHIGFRVAVWP